MSRIDKVIYTARTHTTGGRDGAAQSDDRRLDVRLSPPGGNGAGTNPEQLFAAGWSAPITQTRESRISDSAIAHSGIRR